MKQTILDKFLRYVKIDTQSSDHSDTSPSTSNQFDLARLLVTELQSLGLKDAYCDDHCYVYATLPSTTSRPSPRIGLFAHLDTSPEVSGNRVNPNVIENYRGGDIALSSGIVITESENGDLAKCIGHTLVTSDGTTLLGADDKAGIAAIMSALQHFTEHPLTLHGEVKICFSPDEETGRGMEHFNGAKFDADFAYTVDGGFPGELNKETFSADAALIIVEGRDIHPGKAKNIMVNALRVMGEIVARLPREMAPETTAEYEPFIHPNKIEGSVGRCTLHLILRDFKTEGLGEQKRLLETVINDVRVLYPKAVITLEIAPTYRNMRERLDERPEVTGRLFKAALRAGVEPVWKPIRGGTDGSKLTARGLPTPNIFTGGNNAHSRAEWLSVDALVKAVETIINVVAIDG
jgi:tripeptide aminopeptidase